MSDAPSKESLARAAYEHWRNAMLEKLPRHRPFALISPEWESVNGSTKDLFMLASEGAANASALLFMKPNSERKPHGRFAPYPIPSKRRSR